MKAIGIELTLGDSSESFGQWASEASGGTLSKLAVCG
jgi:hypothetical protein